MPIVIAIDFDKPSVFALRRGAEIFRRSPAFELECLHVIEGAGAVEGEEDEGRQAVADASERVRRFLRDHLGDPSTLSGRRVGVHVRWGDAAVEIVRFADELDAQLVVVGTHGRGGILKKILGSTAERVLESAHAAVVIASGDPRTEPPPIAPPCPDCQKMRSASEGREWWCARHGEKHVRAHAYSHRDEWPFGLHDSEVSPVGVSSTH